MSETEKTLEQQLDNAIERARLLDRSIATVTPNVIPRLSAADVPEDDDPIFKVGFFRTRTGQSLLYVINTIAYPIMATGSMRCELPKIGVLHRLEFAVNVEITRVQIMLQSVNRILDVDPDFLPRRQGHYVVIEHGTLDLPSIPYTHLNVNIHPDARLDGHSVLRITYWQASHA